MSFCLCSSLLNQIVVQPLSDGPWKEAKFETTNGPIAKENLIHEKPVESHYDDKGLGI
jgi:hypothetical protein